MGTQIVCKCCTQILVNGFIKIILGKVQDRTDGKLVHLDGLNFSRAYNLYSIIINLNATTKATTNLK
jgi:hypothetical protein